MRPLRMSAVTVGLCVVIVGSSAAATPPPLAVNGAWSGRSAQGLAITLTVRNHLAVELSARIRRTPDPGVPTSACPVVTVGGLIDPRDHTDTFTNQRSFGLAKDPEWQISGSVRSATRVTGTIDFSGDGSEDPCSAQVRFVLHPRPAA